jgi:hypothetical protein
MLTQESRLPGAELFQHRRFTFQGIFQRVMARRVDLIFVYIGDGLWHRFSLSQLDVAVWELSTRETEALVVGQVVKSFDMTGRESELDRRLYLVR